MTIDAGKTMPGYRNRVLTGSILALLVWALLLSTGCEDQQQPPLPDVSTAPAPTRIVSLAPALSRMLVDLDLADWLVGVGQSDAAAPPGLPVVGTFMDINTEKLLVLRPTHVLMMTGRGGLPPGLVALSKAQGFVLVGYPIPSDVTQIQAIIAGQPPPPGLGVLLGIEARANGLAARLRHQFTALQRITAEAPRPRVLMVFGIEPTTMASGPGTMLDVLLQYAGGVNAAANASTTAPSFDREKLLANNPQVVLLLLPGSPPLGSLADDSRLAAFRGLSIAAQLDRRIHLIDDPLVLLPGSNVAQIAALMAKAIHPELADQIDQAMTSAAGGSSGKAEAAP